MLPPLPGLLFLQVPHAPRLPRPFSGKFCGLTQDCSSPLPPSAILISHPLMYSLPPAQGQRFCCAAPCSVPSSLHSAWTTVGVR